MGSNDLNEFFYSCWPSFSLPFFLKLSAVLDAVVRVTVGQEGLGAKWPARSLAS